MNRFVAALCLLAPALAAASPPYSECFADADCAPLCATKAAEISAPQRVLGYGPISCASANLACSCAARIDGGAPLPDSLSDRTCGLWGARGVCFAAAASCSEPDGGGDAVCTRACEQANIAAQGEATTSVNAGILGVKCATTTCQCAVEVEGRCFAVGATKFSRSTRPIVGPCNATALFAAQAPTLQPVVTRGCGCNSGSTQLSVLAGAMMAFALWRRRKK